MNGHAIDPHLDLTIHRVIHAPPQLVWQAWTDPTLLCQWWTPAPTISRVDVLDVRPGGGFVTSISDNGQSFTPHTDGIFLVVDEDRRLAFTNVITSAWRPAAPAPVPMTAEVRFDPHPDGTAYTAVVRHGSRAECSRHEEFGFFDGWGSITDALAGLVEHGRPS